MIFYSFTKSYLSKCHHSWRGILDTTLCNKVCQRLATGRWFSPGILVSSINKTDCHDITEIQCIVESGVKHQNPNTDLSDIKNSIWQLVQSKNP